MDAVSSGAHLLRLPSTIYVGEGTHRQVAGEAKRLGSHVLVVTDIAVGALPQTREIISTMTEAGLAVTVFDDIPGEPTTIQVDAGLEKLRAAGADVVVAIGGGSCIDTAKSVAAMAQNPGHLREYIGFGKLSLGRLPLIAVATTAGTGSEVTSYIAMTDPVANVKMLIGDPLFNAGCRGVRSIAGDELPAFRSRSHRVGCFDSRDRVLRQPKGDAYHRYLRVGGSRIDRREPRSGVEKQPESAGPRRHDAWRPLRRHCVFQLVCRPCPRHVAANRRLLSRYPRYRKRDVAGGSDAIQRRRGGGKVCRDRTKIDRPAGCQSLGHNLLRRAIE